MFSSLSPSLNDFQMDYEPLSNSVPHSSHQLSHSSPPSPSIKRRRLQSPHSHNLPPSTTPHLAPHSNSTMPLSPHPAPGPATDSVPDPPMSHKRPNSPDLDAELQTSASAGPSNQPSTNPHKRSRRLSPPPQDRGTKRPIPNSGSPPAQPPKTKRVKKNKSAKNPRSNIALKKNVSKHKFQIGSALQPPASTDPLPNFVTNPESLTEYASQVAKADSIRVQGNSAYKRGRYGHAIQLYSRAMAAYPRQHLPGQPYHDGYCSSLANRGWVYMVCGDYQAAASDLRQSLESSHLPPLLTQQLKTTLAKRLYRLVRCHLALLSYQPARYALEHVCSPSSPLVIYPDESLFQELSTLSMRVKFLSEAEQHLEEARADQSWQAALDVIQKVEDEAHSWGHDWKSRQRLPGLWSFWRGEALARLGKPMEADAAVLQALRDFPPRELGLIEALISFAAGSLSRAITALDKLLQDLPNDKVVRELSLLANQIKSKLDGIDNLSAIEPIEAAQLCGELLPMLASPFTASIRLRVCLMQSEELTRVIHEDPKRAYDYINLVTKTVDHVLTNEIGFSIDSPDTCSPVHRPYVVRALFTRARATRTYMPASAMKSYSAVFDLLVNVWPSGVTPLRKLYLEEVFEVTGLEPPPPPINADGLSDEDPKGYYHTLGISITASMAEVKKAFRTLSLANHPDKGGETSKFQAINQANSVLSDPERRKSYDKGGKI